MPLLGSVAGLVDNFNVGPLTVNRPGLPTQNVRGGFTPATSSTFQLDPVAAVQASGRSLLQAPEADRNEAQVEFYAKVRLHVADGLQVADRVTYEARSYRVTKVENYRQQGGVYCATATLEETGQPA